MTDHNFKDAPDGLEPPIQISGDQTQCIFWEGEAELRQKSRDQKGDAKIIFCMHPAPEFRFEFVPHEVSSPLAACLSLKWAKRLLTADRLSEKWLVT